MSSSQTSPGPAAAPNIPTDRERSLASYFDAFAPAPDWDELPRWPPDVFALTNLLLDHTGGYRFVVAPPPGKRWPPIPDWGEQMRDAGRNWRATQNGRQSALPPLVTRYWGVVTQQRDTSLTAIRNGEASELVAALLALHAMADEACADVVSAGRQAAPPEFEARAWNLLQRQRSLSRVAPTRLGIFPKTHFSARGITIRSLSRYLALSYEPVDVRWGSIGPGRSAERRDYNIVLVPWPLSINARDFRAAPPDLLENMDLDRYGFFEFVPDAGLDLDLLASLLEAAVERSGRVDAVVFPETAIEREAIVEAERTVARYGATFLIAGVREPPDASELGRNYLHFGVHTRSGWRCYEQDKHHRWCLDEAQIRQYHLSRSLSPRKLWWEAINLGERRLHVIDVGGGLTAAPMVCEDLARLDEVAELVRRIGPSLVVAVLLDGPQLASRWPCRYSSILADDPGAAVLTLTSYGMAARSRPGGSPHSRVVAHWNSPVDGLQEIELAPRAAAIQLSMSVESSTMLTADGRSHPVPYLDLTEVHQLRAK